MLLFILGPSGAGKTLLLSRVRPLLSDVTFIDLDKEEEKALLGMDQSQHRGWEGRWERGLELLHRLEHNVNDFVVDVGAGSLQTEAAFRYFSDHLEKVILVTADQDVLCKRRSRSLKNLLQNEFTGAHKETLRIHTAHHGKRFERLPGR